MRESRELTMELPDAAATGAAGGDLARAAEPAARSSGLTVALEGELGAGKTTLVRGCLAALGHAGLVRSPTYTLLESYPLAQLTVHHLDGFRLDGAEDFEALGIRELAGPGRLVLIEWASRADSVAAASDLTLRLDFKDTGRRLTVEPTTPTGASVRDALKDRWRLASKTGAT
jgi:tRNA threonylcarbamoyladenosine biosynthesis protein TsaE